MHLGFISNCEQLGTVRLVVFSGIPGAKIAWVTPEITLVIPDPRIVWFMHSVLEVWLSSIRVFTNIDVFLLCPKLVCD